MPKLLVTYGTLLIIMQIYFTFDLHLLTNNIITAIRDVTIRDMNASCPGPPLVVSVTLDTINGVEVPLTNELVLNL